MFHVLLSSTLRTSPFLYLSDSSFVMCENFQKSFANIISYVVAVAATFFFLFRFGRLIFSPNPYFFCCVFRDPFVKGGRAETFPLHFSFTLYPPLPSPSQYPPNYPQLYYCYKLISRCYVFFVGLHLSVMSTSWSSFSPYCEWRGGWHAPLTRSFART